jgi:hypothetical protein
VSKIYSIINDQEGTEWEEEGEEIDDDFEFGNSIQKLIDEINNADDEDENLIYSYNSQSNSLPSSPVLSQTAHFVNKKQRLDFIKLLTVKCTCKLVCKCKCHISANTSKTNSKSSSYSTNINDNLSLDWDDNVNLDLVDSYLENGKKKISI